MIIYAVKIQDERIATILNFVKYICEPTSKTEVHLSVRGPYEKKLAGTLVQRYSEEILNKLIEVNGVGTFFNEKQNTVYIRCDSEYLRNIWKKTSYGYNPHLTLYDGKDQGFANSLYNAIKDYNIHLYFHASELILYDTSRKGTSLLLTMGINFGIIKEITGIDWDKLNPSVFKNNTKKKIEIIKSCFDSLMKL